MELVRYSAKEILEISRNNNLEEQKNLDTIPNDEEVDFSDIPKLDDLKLSEPMDRKEFLASVRRKKEVKDFLSFFEDDVIEAVKLRANKPQEIAHMNAVLRVLLETMP